MWSEGKEIEKNVVSCTVGHTRNRKGHRRIILHNGNTMSVDCPPGDIATVTHITTLALRASLGYWRCLVPFWFISFSLQIPLPQCFPIESKWCTVCLHAYLARKGPGTKSLIQICFRNWHRHDVGLCVWRVSVGLFHLTGHILFLLFCHRKWWSHKAVVLTLTALH